MHPMTIAIALIRLTSLPTFDFQHINFIPAHNLHRFSLARQST
jgi:hypothetical protein